MIIHAFDWTNQAKWQAEGQKDELMGSVLVPYSGCTLRSRANDKVTDCMCDRYQHKKSLQDMIYDV